MKIGIDARIIYHKGAKQKSHIGLCVYNMLKCLLKHKKHHKYVLFFDSRIPHQIAEKYAQKSRNIIIKYFPFSQYRKFIRQTYSQFLVSAFLAKERLDIFHACAGTMPLIYPGKVVLTLHKIETSRHGRALQKSIIKKAKKIVVGSEHFKKRLIKAYKIKEEKIEVLRACSAEQILNIYKQV